MTLDIYTPYQLALVREDPRQTVTTSHWLDMFFPNTFVSTQEEIAFSKLNASRRIAPFMLPNEPGKPIYRREGERIESFKPAYTKPKDAVRPSEMIALTPGEIVTREALLLQTKALCLRHDPYAYCAVTDPQQMLQLFLQSNVEQQGQIWQDYVKASVAGCELPHLQLIARHVGGASI